MAELGYVEGQNIVYDVQQTGFDMAAYKRILQGFVADEVDLILVFPTEASIEAKAATEGTDIPVLFNFAFIEGIGLVESVREPGGNVTGVRYPGPDVALKRFEVMREIVPGATRLLLPYQRGYPSVASQLEILRPAAAAAGVTLLEAPVSDAAELEADLAGRAAGGDPGVDAILLLAEPLGLSRDAFAVLGKFAAAHKLPIGGALMSVDGYDSLFGVTVNVDQTGRQAAPLADKILKGTPAGTIPVASPESFLLINYREAQEMGLTVPEGLLSQAHEIIR
jgi:putative ABC transport system substrate-binding protein